MIQYSTCYDYCRSVLSLYYVFQATIILSTTILMDSIRSASDPAAEESETFEDRMFSPKRLSVTLLLILVFLDAGLGSLPLVLC